jgi:hypothetical protein
MTTAIQFKDDRVRSEWTEDNRVDPRIRTLVYLAHGYILATFGVPATLTCLIRTVEENTALYGYDRPSVHVYGRGADLRCTGDGFPTTAGASIADFLNAVASYGWEATKNVALHELPASSKRGEHVHLQVPAFGGTRLTV